MNTTYRNVAIAASGILIVTVAGSLLKRRASSSTMVAQVLTVRMSRDNAYAALARDPSLFTTALQCEENITLDFSDDMRVVEWSVPSNHQLDGRLALIAAPAGRGTELHIAMRGEKYEVKDVVRKLKALLEAGEIPTGARYQ